jgi:hypothetical protein
VLNRRFRELWEDFDRAAQPMRPVELPLGVKGEE